ncbi:MAG: cysteine--tRNA ligase [Anaerolineaceae bacterium]|jgi:cysteinyl-tRNA synthetase|nr:cysteine--tRNA ligase [Anaerolineaceae bacterium]MDD4042843.1 cysteine--tRNA ligase [Anaerolineaceae bacterium]MDD4578925.1 cysteine--tRNA ligase [Anaerolineaceae bacterium]
MALKIYNTLTRTKEEFTTLEPGKVRMYVCGPTVYADAHLGHAMSALVFDIARRYLEYKGYEVRYVMNFTDVDDKIINKANELGVDPFSLAEQYIAGYKRNLEELNIKPASVNPRATEDMPQIIEMIQQLIYNDSAYVVDGDVYYSVDSDDDYGKLSGRSIQTMNAGSRIQVDERKEHPMDFALWKSAKPGEPAWESPWGKGRPGWHIECSAMNMVHLGDQIDIHGGGNDLIFPHHENEIAQTESITGKPFARFWMHNGMMGLKDDKMSKSLGNMVTIDQFLSEHPGDVMRLWVLNGSYRSPLTYSEAVIEQTTQGYKRLLSAKKGALPGSAGLSENELAKLQDAAQAARQGFVEAMDDDFNTALAMATIYELGKTINQARADGATDTQLGTAQSVFDELTSTLGLKLEEETAVGTSADAFIDLLVALRRDLRAEKNWAMSDEIRDKLKSLGVILEDSKDGSTWSWES